MDKTFWLERWRDKKTGFHREIPNPALVKHYPDFDLARDDVVFVPLCGKSLDLLWLHQLGHSVVGVEISALAIQQFFNDNKIPFHQEKKDGLEVYVAEGPDYAVHQLKIFCCDFFDLQSKHLSKPRGIYDRAALIALPPEMRQNYCKKMVELCPPDPKMFLISIEYDQTKIEGPPFNVDEAEVRKLFEKNFSIKIISDKEVEPANSRFLECGLKLIREKIYLLQRKAKA